MNDSFEGPVQTGLLKGVLDSRLVNGPEDLPDGPLSDFYHYWVGKMADSGLPSRHEIDAAELPNLLRHLMLVDVVPTEDGRRFRFRLMGEQHIAVAGRNVTGQFMDEALETDVDEVQASYDLVADTRKPHYWRHRFLIVGGEKLTYERTLFPLADDGGTVDTVVSVLVHTVPPSRLPEVSY